MRMPSPGLWILPVVGIAFCIVAIGEAASSFAGGAWTLFDFFDSTWQPDLHHWGLVPMFVGSLATALLAWGLAFPWALSLSLGILAGPSWFRRLEPLLHGLLGIPSLLYGFFSVCTVVQVLRLLGAGNGYSILAVSGTLAVLILPTLCLGFLAGWRQIPISMWQSTQCLGFTPLQQARALLPAMAPTLRRATQLGIGRALGDCMVALFVSGNVAKIPQYPTDGIRTLSAHMALVAGLDPYSPGFASLFGAAFCLALLAWGLPELLTRFTIPKIQWNGWPRLEAWIWQGLVGGAPFLLLGLWLSIGSYVGVQVVRGLQTATLVPATWMAPLCTSLLLAGCTVLVVVPLGTWIAVRVWATPSSFWRYCNEGVLRFFAGLPSLWIGIGGLLGVLAFRKMGFASMQLGVGVAVFCLSLLALPAMVQTLQAGLAQLPRRWDRTGDLLGYSPRWMWWHVVLPHLKPHLRHGALLVAVRALEDTAVCLVTGAVAFATFPLDWRGGFSSLSFHIFFLADQFHNEGERAQLFVMGWVWISTTWLLLGIRYALTPVYRKQKRGKLCC